MVMAVSVIGGLNASAASSFQITDKNFKPVFDFDTTPGTYQNGDTKVGTRTDTVGDSKSEKCIDAQGVGLTYNLAIDSSNAVRGNALKLSVTDQAPEGGAYCPISFNVRYGQNNLARTKLCGFKHRVGYSKSGFLGYPVRYFGNRFFIGKHRRFFRFVR